MDGDKIVSAEIADCLILNIEEINNIRDFLNEIEKTIKNKYKIDFTEADKYDPLVGQMPSAKKESNKLK